MTAPASSRRARAANPGQRPDEVAYLIQTAAKTIQAGINWQAELRARPRRPYLPPPVKLRVVVAVGLMAPASPGPGGRIGGDRILHRRQALGVGSEAGLQASEQGVQA